MGVLPELFQSPVRSGDRIGDVPLNDWTDAQLLDGTPALYALHYKAAHAPPGGVTIQGKTFAGGQFIPSEVMDQASPEEKAAVESGQSNVGGGVGAGGPPPGTSRMPAQGQPVGAVTAMPGITPPPPSFTPPPLPPGGQQDTAGAPLKPPPITAEQAQSLLASSRLFTPEQLNLPKKVNMPHATAEQLYTAANQVQGVFQKVLDTGEGVDRAIGAKSTYVTSLEEFNRALEQEGPIVLIAPLKGMKRAAEKVAADYGGDWSLLHDVVRGTVGIDSVQEIPQALGALQKELTAKGWRIAKQPKNKFETPTDSGYRDINLSFVTDNGLVGEIQINTKSMLKAKEEAHKIYEEQRTIEANAKITGRDLTPDEVAAIDAMNAKQKAIYDRAWQQSLGNW